MTIKVLIVDDEAMVRAGLRMILEAQDDISVCGEADDGGPGVSEALRLRPDVVLIDIRMRQMDGLEAAKEILAMPDPPKVVVLTTFDLDDYVYDALRTGASAFLLKDSAPEQIVAAVHVVARGDALIHPSVTRRLIADFSRRQPRPEAYPGLEQLTSRETDVLKCIATGLSNKEVARTLFLSETTVKTHVAHILSKLGVRDRVQAVVVAYESGMVQAGG